MSLRSLLVLGTLLAFAVSSQAQFTWRTDYAAAVAEATRTGKPILLDFGTESCVWCKKLDATTFKDPAIAGLLASKFVAVKVDAEKSRKLAEALNVHSFPTLILAGPDGTILDRHEGYADVATMRGLLDRALAKSPTKPAADRPKFSRDAESSERSAPANALRSEDSASRLNGTSARRMQAAALLALARLDDQLGCAAACRERCGVIAKEFADCPEAEDDLVLMRSPVETPRPPR